MVLTREPRKPRNPDSFPTTQLFILGMNHCIFPRLQPDTDPCSLAICRVSEPIALCSCLPYAWPMVRDFSIGDKSNASFYAGVFISAFALAESLTGMFWGGFSDRIGRKPVLLLGCAGTMISMLVVGFSTNFWVALAGRLGGGLLSMVPYCGLFLALADISADGNIGVIQTMVGELVKKPEHER